MLSNDYFENEPAFVDSSGNRVSRRKLPDGTEFEVVKNFPSEGSLRSVLMGHGKTAEYLEFSELERWAVIYTV